MTGPRSLLYGLAILSALTLVACSGADSSPEAEAGGEPAQMPAAGPPMEAAEASGLADPQHDGRGASCAGAAHHG